MVYIAYIDRVDAGRELAKRLKEYKGGQTVVLALPRGGIMPGAEVAKTLRAPLGLMLVRKIGHPAYSEYAIGAVAENETAVYNERAAAQVDEAWLKQAEVSARQLIKQRRQLYYGKDFTPPEIQNKVVILVDDGIATGLTMEAAARAAKRKHPKKLIVAVPVAPEDSITALKGIADEVIVLSEPASFLGAVGAHYHEFEQVNDEEVRALLREVRDGVRQTASAHAATA